MNNITTKLIITGVLSLGTLISGVAVSRAGRPLNDWLFGIHKLVAIAAAVLIVISARALFQALGARTALEMGLLALTGALFLALLVTGGLLSFDRPLPALVLRVHQVAPPLSLISAAVALLRLAGQAG